MKKFVVLMGLVSALSTPAWAATKTVTLSMHSMTCVTCPITVRMALSRVPGVENAQVSFERREAIVTFDSTKTTVEVLAKATENAGFPSTVKR